MIAGMPLITKPLVKKNAEFIFKEFRDPRFVLYKLKEAYQESTNYLQSVNSYLV